MKIKATSVNFESLIIETDKKSEIRVYKMFIAVLSDLENKELSDKQIQSIENKLETLQLNESHENRKKYFNKKYSELLKFLKDEFSFVSEGYYTGIGMIFGMIFGNSIGLTIGIIIGEGDGIAIGLSMGTGIGMVLGMLFGASKDAEAKKQGRVLKTNVK